MNSKSLLWDRGILVTVTLGLKVKCMTFSQAEVNLLCSLGWRLYFHNISPQPEPGT